jgi:hypothetical protein
MEMEICMTSKLNPFAYLLVGVWTIMQFTSVSFAASDVPHCLPYQEAVQAQLSDFEESAIVISKLEIGKIDDYNFPTYLFRLEQIQQVSNETKFPFLKSQKAVKELTRLLSLGVPVLINQRCEMYGGVVLFSESQSKTYRSFAEKLNLPIDSQIPIFVMQAQATDDVVIHEMAHVKQALEGYNENLSREMQKAFENQKFDWTKMPSDQQNLASDTFELVREAPAYDKQISYLMAEISQEHKARVQEFKSGQWPINQQLLRLNSALEKLTDKSFKEALCAVLSAHFKELKNVNFMALVHSCK